MRYTLSQMSALASTAKWTAAQRARESDRPDRLFDDPMARVLAGEDGMLSLRLSEHANPHHDASAAYIVVRTKFLDDFMARAARGMRQAVILAAGLDTRAFRLDLPADMDWYELDQAEVIGRKESLLARANAPPRCRRHAVPVDLTGDWMPALRQAGFRPAEPSLWLLEGILYYLAEEQVRALLQGIAAGAAPGSALAGDMVSASYFSSPWTKKTLEALAAGGMAWQFGTDEPEAFLAAYGWRATVAQPGEERAHFGRWIAPVAPRELRALPHVFLVTAERV